MSDDKTMEGDGLGEDELFSEHGADLLENVIRAKRDNPSRFAKQWESDDGDSSDVSDIDLTDPGKKLLYSAEHGDLTTVVAILDARPDLVNIKDSDGYTPLHRACYSKHVDVAKTLIHHGADINAQTKDGWTPLHSSCKWNSFQCATLLLHNGANPNATTCSNQSPLHLAALDSSYECLCLLLMNRYIDAKVKNSAGDTALDLARRSGNYAYLFECVNENVTDL